MTPVPATLGDRPPLRALRDARVRDPVVAVLLAVSSLYALWHPSPLVDGTSRDADALGVVLVLLSTLPVAGRSRWPVPALVVSASTSLLHAQMGYSQGVGNFAPLLVLYTAALIRGARLSAALAVAVMGGLVLTLATGPVDVGVSDYVTNLVVIGAAWGLGRSVRIRRDHHAQLQARNEALVEARQAETDRMLVEERARTAREMQDLVAHNLTEVSVQIAAARRVLSRDPDTAEAMLLDAERLGRVALEEMRRAGGVLETDGAVAELRPQPGIDDLADLVVGRGGDHGRLSLHSSGTPAPVLPGVGLAAYRFVEEVVDDLGATRAGTPLEVLVSWADRSLEVAVCTGGDVPSIAWDQPPLPESTLTRLRTRVEAYGGALHVGGSRDGTTRVAASFPITARRPNP